MLAAGRAMDEDGAPLRGLVVTAHHGAPGVAERGLSRAVTDPEGTFRLPVPDDGQARVLALRDRAGVRVLAQRGIPAARDASVTFVVPRAEAEGLAVTLGESGPARLTSGNDVRFLVDGEELFRELVRLVDDARESVRVSQLRFEPGLTATFDEAHGTERRLLDALADAARRGVRVRVLLNENAVLPDSVDEVRAAFAAHGVDPERVVRPVRMTFNVMHTKVLIADGRAGVLVSSTFEQRFWDAPSHAFHDARRGPDQQPLHHVSMRLEGPAVHYLSATFAEVWNHARRGDVSAERLGVPPVTPARGTTRAQVVRTMPPGLAPGGAHEGGERGILEGYLRAFAHAERFIYLENQYFTSAVVTRALLAALDAKPGLEVILVANEHVDIPGYDQWQAARVERLREHPRFGAFSLWSTGFDPEAGLERVRPIYVHSKLAIVDDAWLTTGNANLDGASLHAAVEFARPDKVNVEANVGVLDAGLVRSFRRRLWAEHFQAPEASLDAPPPRGWLAAWRERAARNAEAVRREDLPAVRGRLLPLYPELPERRVREPPLVPG